MFEMGYLPRAKSPLVILISLQPRVCARSDAMAVFTTRTRNIDLGQVMRQIDACVERNWHRLLCALSARPALASASYPTGLGRPRQCGTKRQAGAVATRSERMCSGHKRPRS